MQISIEDLKKVKGIGPKAIERIENQMGSNIEEDNYESKYNEDIHLALNEIHLGDCLELMEGIPDNSVDMILADLPYGTTASEWDKLIPASILWKQYERIIKDMGAIVLYSSGRFTNKLVNSNPDLYRYKWIWKKSRTGNFVNANNRPLTQYEEINVFSKGITANTPNADLKMPYNPQGLVEVNKHVKAGESKFGSMHGKRPGHQESYTAKYTNYPTDVIEFKSVGKPTHPTEKPVALNEYLIKTYTSKGEVVLDNVSGSGSTVEACINTGRNYIAIEKEAEYVEMSKQRVRDVIEGE